MTNSDQSQTSQKTLPPVSIAKLIHLSVVSPKFRRWILGSWLALVLLSAIGVWSTAPYRISSTRFDFLPANLQAPPQIPLGRLTNGNILLATAATATTTVAQKQLIQWSPKNNKYYLLNGQEYQAGKTTPDASSSLDQKWFNDYSFVLLPDNTVVSVSGADVMHQKLANLQITHLDSPIGAAPLVVGLSDTEVLIAGDNRAVSTHAGGDGANYVGSSKLFKFNIITNRLADTGKTVPTIFGSEVSNSPVVYDAGKFAVIWTMKGDLWKLDKKTLSIHQVARGLSQQTGQTYNQIVRLDNYRFWISPPIMNLNGRGYVYDSRASKVYQQDFSSPVSSGQKTELNSSTPYLVYPISYRLVLFLPNKEGLLSNKLKDLVAGRLAYDIPTHRVIRLNQQITGIHSLSDTAERVLLFKAIAPNASQLLLTATSENINYRHGLITRPWWWANPANQIGLIGTLLITLIGAISLLYALRAQMR